MFNSISSPVAEPPDPASVRHRRRHNVLPRRREARSVPHQLFGRMSVMIDASFSAAILRLPALFTPQNALLSYGWDNSSFHSLAFHFVFHNFLI
jgi:hypothetical protein